MFERRSIKTPIVLGVTLIVLLVLLIVGWVLLAVFGALADQQYRSVYITMLSVGCVLLVFVLVGVVLYLTFSIQAINVNRRQANFIDSVTHELKSPIASLKLYLQTLNRRQVAEAERATFYRTMLDDVERLDQLINHLLEAGRVDKQRDDSGSEVENVRLDRLLESCADSVCPRYRVPREAVKIDSAPCTLRTRRVDLDLILRNLIDNAVKYAGNQPKVQVTLRQEPRWVVVRVGDNGCGIPSGQRRKIFGRFVRLGLELERDKPGTGLGLHIVRTLIRRLRGRIRVRDPEDGPGTVFEVSLPDSLLVPTDDNDPGPAADTSPGGTAKAGAAS